MTSEGSSRTSLRESSADELWNSAVARRRQMDGRKSHAFWARDKSSGSCVGKGVAEDQWRCPECQVQTHLGLCLVSEEGIEGERGQSYAFWTGLAQKILNQPNPGRGFGACIHHLIEGIIICFTCLDVFSCISFWWFGLLARWLTVPFRLALKGNEMLLWCYVLLGSIKCHASASFKDRTQVLFHWPKNKVCLTMDL